MLARLVSYRSPMRILVIEDEARILSFVQRGLEAEGYAVEGACDGEEGLRLALAKGWDLLVLDLRLPGRNGLEVLRDVHRERPELPVLVLSARADVPTKLRGFELGAADYVPKPFSLDELLARVRVQLRRHRSIGEDENLLRAGRLVLDLARRQARFCDTVCDLSDREFRMLREFVAHEGEVLSRERLLADVWGYGFDPGSNVVDVCVRRLRKKLGPDAPIETVRFAGYRLVA
jgi:two-component system, OmpR family, response regulator